MTGRADGAGLLLAQQGLSGWRREDWRGAHWHGVMARRLWRGLCPSVSCGLLAAGRVRACWPQLIAGGDLSLVAVKSMLASPECTEGPGAEAGGARAQSVLVAGPRGAGCIRAMRVPVNATRLGPWFESVSGAPDDPHDADAAVAGKAW